MNLKEEPVIFLARRLWRFSAGNRKNVILYIVLFTIAKFLNIIQQEGITSQTLPSLIGYLSLILVITILFWIFHGPARVIENKNAFLAKANYQKYFLEGVMNLPAKWHTNHHSGDTIDKI